MCFKMKHIGQVGRLKKNAFNLPEEYTYGKTSGIS